MVSRMDISRHGSRPVDMILRRVRNVEESSAYSVKGSSIPTKQSPVFVLGCVSAAWRARPRSAMLALPVPHTAQLRRS